MIHRPIGWVDAAPVQILRTAVLNAAAMSDWDKLARNETWTDWFPDFKSFIFTTPPVHGQGQNGLSIRAGSKWERSLHFGNRGFVGGMTLSSIYGPVLRSMAKRMELTAQSSDKTQLDWRIGIELSLLDNILKRPLVEKISKSPGIALANLNAGLKRERRL